MRTIIVCVGLLCIAAPGALAAGDDEIRKAEKSWAAAVVARDYPALEKIFAADLIYAHSTGAIESKQEYIARLRSGKQKYDRIEHESTRVAMHGDSAVTHSLLRMSGVSNGRDFNDHVMALHCWIKQEGAWRLVAHQTTKLP